MKKGFTAFAISTLLCGGLAIADGGHQAFAKGGKGSSSSSSSHSSSRGSSSHGSSYGSSRGSSSHGSSYGSSRGSSSRGSSYGSSRGSSSRGTSYGSSKGKSSYGTSYSSSRGKTSRSSSYGSSKRGSSNESLFDSSRSLTYGKARERSSYGSLSNRSSRVGTSSKVNNRNRYSNGIATRASNLHNNLSNRSFGTSRNITNSRFGKTRTYGKTTFTNSSNRNTKNIGSNNIVTKNFRSNFVTRRGAGLHKNRTRFGTGNNLVVSNRTLQNNRQNKTQVNDVSPNVNKFVSKSVTRRGAGLHKNRTRFGTGNNIVISNKTLQNNKQNQTQLNVVSPNVSKFRSRIFRGQNMTFYRTNNNQLIQLPNEN